MSLVGLCQEKKKKSRSDIFMLWKETTHGFSDFISQMKYLLNILLIKRQSLDVLKTLYFSINLSRVFFRNLSPYDWYQLHSREISGSRIKSASPTRIFFHTSALICQVVNLFFSRKKERQCRNSAQSLHQSSTTPPFRGKNCFWKPDWSWKYFLTF